MWWIASRAEDEQYKGKNSLLRGDVLVLGGCVDELDLVQDEMPPTMVASPIYRGPGPLPNIEREGSQQWRANLKGDSEYTYPDKSSLRLPKALVMTLRWAPW